MKLRAFMIPFAAAGVGLLMGELIAILLGVRPGRFLGALLGETLFTGYGLGQVLFRATALIFTGLAVALPFRAGLFNIGGEGQMTVGGFTMTLVGIHLAGLPGPWLWIVCIATACAAGGAWGGIAGLLKARTGAHEVIATILLNFIAAALANYMLSAHYALPETVRTANVGEGAWMARAADGFGFFHGSGLSTAFPFAIGAAIACEAILYKTRLGFAWRILWGGAARARYARLSPGRLTFLSMALGGALAGAGSCSYILGYKRYYEEGFGGGAGFVGIAVALLARNRPAAIPAAAFLFGLLSQGGLAVNQLVPREIVDLLMGVVLISFIILDARAREGGSRWISS